MFQSIKLEKIRTRDAVDAIIITDIFNFRKKRQALILNGYAGKIVSIEDIIFGITM